MKVSVLTASIIFILTGCSKPPVLSLAKNPGQIIALQPLDSFPLKEVLDIRSRLTSFFKKQVIILEPVNIPGSFKNKELEEYSSDSIINILSKLTNGSIIEIAGLTHKSLYTVKYSSRIPYYDENIFGIGYLPGNACVVSDYKFKTPDKELYLTRITNVILHEIGHNMGLPHCNNPVCIMSANNFNMLDNPKSDYCDECRRKLSD